MRRIKDKKAAVPCIVSGQAVLELDKLLDATQLQVER